MDTIHKIVSVVNLVSILIIPIIDMPKFMTQKLPNELQPIQTEKTTDPLDQWLLKLSKNENCPIEGMIDDNGKKSYSALCFQLDTFKRYVKKYNLLPYAEDYEIINMIDDKEFQFKLAKMMILDDYNNHNHWKNTVKVIGLPPKT